MRHHRIHACIAVAFVAGAIQAPRPAWANGFNESAPWGFQTTQDKVNRGAVLDLIERKKGGFYDSFQTTTNITNNTHIGRQVNCSVSATTTGNSGSNGMSAATSSPTVTSSSGISAGTTANAATNAATQDPFGWVQTRTGTVDNQQGNSGSLNSSVNGSTTGASTGSVQSGGGRSSQALNSNQNSEGVLTAGVAGSTACSGPLNAN